MCVKSAEASWRGIMKCFRMRVLRWKHPFRRRSGDAQAMKRILGNLIQNALRYGADGRYLGISVAREDRGLAIRVTDRGKGIVEENQDKIFERLTTLEDSRNKKYQGSGLGLTITKRLTEAMGGSIRVKSRPYRETVFTLFFPQGVQM